MQCTFIQKPIDRDYFVAWLKRAIQLRRLSRAVERQNQMLERTVQERTADLERTNRDLKAALEHERQSEERFRALVSQATAGITQADHTGKFLFANDRYCDIVGYSREELLQVRMQDITDPDVVATNVGRYQRMWLDGMPFVIEKQYIRKDGSRVWIINSVAPVIGKDGKTESVVCVTLDITERKRADDALRESEERYRNLYDSIDEGFCIIEVMFDENNGSVDYVFREVNLSFEKQPESKMCGAGACVTSLRTTKNIGLDCTAR